MNKTLACRDFRCKPSIKQVFVAVVVEMGHMNLPGFGCDLL